MPWSQKRRPPTEYVSDATRRAILDRDAGICHVCRHPGADQCDHVVPWAEWVSDGDVHHPTNLAAIHSLCPECGARCHDRKTAAEAARGRQRKAATRRRPAERHPGVLQ